MTSGQYVVPFLRYMWFKGRPPSEPSWFGWAVDSSKGMCEKVFHFFFLGVSTGFFLFFCFLPRHHFFAFGTTLTSFPLVCSTCSPCPPPFNRVCPICLSTLLHHPCPCPPSATSLKTCSPHATCCFLLHHTDWRHQPEPATTSFTSS